MPNSRTSSRILMRRGRRSDGRMPLVVQPRPLSSTTLRANKVSVIGGCCLSFWSRLALSLEIPVVEPLSVANRNRNGGAGRSDIPLQYLPVITQNGHHGRTQEFLWQSFTPRDDREETVDCAPAGIESCLAVGALHVHPFARQKEWNQWQPPIA